mgnify:CR=1 FL=1
MHDLLFVASSTSHSVYIVLGVLQRAESVKVIISVGLSLAVVHGNGLRLTGRVSVVEILCILSSHPDTALHWLTIGKTKQAKI